MVVDHGVGIMGIMLPMFPKVDEWTSLIYVRSA